VATAIGVEVREGVVGVEGDLDFRGTLGVSKEVPVGFQHIRLYFDLETDASEEQLTTPFGACMLLLSDKTRTVIRDTLIGNWPF